MASPLRCHTLPSKAAFILASPFEPFPSSLASPSSILFRLSSHRTCSPPRFAASWAYVPHTPLIGLARSTSEAVLDASASNANI